MALKNASKSYTLQNIRLLSRASKSGQIFLDLMYFVYYLPENSPLFW